METNTSLVPIIISKQFWAEASGIFFSSNTFHFQDAQPLRRLAITIRKFVERVSDIRITLQSPLDMAVWASILTSSILGRFRNIRGLTLEVIVVPAWHNNILQRKDVMRDARWKALKLPAIIRAFQQHELKEEHTAVVFARVVYGHDDGEVMSSIVDAQGLERIIKDQLLDHHPRRLSKRGQGGE